jgi:hypothetical protein
LRSLPYLQGTLASFLPPAVCCYFNEYAVTPC